MDWLDRLFPGEANAGGVEQGGGKKDFGFLSDANELLEELDNDELEDADK